MVRIKSIYLDLNLTTPLRIRTSSEPISNKAHQIEPIENSHPAFHRSNEAEKSLALKIEIKRKSFQQQKTTIEPLKNSRKAARLE
jgi:hypothetical protein